jgi:hypothetical protein
MSSSWRAQNEQESVAGEKRRRKAIVKAVCLTEHSQIGTYDMVILACLPRAQHATDYGDDKSNDRQ